MSYHGGSSDDFPESYQDDSSLNSVSVTELPWTQSRDSPQPEKVVKSPQRKRGSPKAIVSKFSTKRVSRMSLFPQPPPAQLDTAPLMGTRSTQASNHSISRSLSYRSAGLHEQPFVEEGLTVDQNHITAESLPTGRLHRMRSAGDLMLDSPSDQPYSHFQAGKRSNGSPSPIHRTQTDHVSSSGHSSHNAGLDGPVSYVPPIPPKSQNMRSELLSRQVDLFSLSTFEQVLNDPTTNYQLLMFSRTRLCGEDVEFLGRTEEYHRALGALTKMLADIDNDFLSPRSKTPISLPDATLDATHRRVKHVVKKTTPVLELVLREAQQRMQQTVFAELYPRFVRHQLTLSASRALSNDRARFQGLGDCFCLTDPRKADNPIVFASDGFVAVTGYSRSQIVPRNCRFLQGQDTDREAVARLRQCIRTGQESVELLLNYKQNGEPFWNLLYCAPLFSPAGEIDFFLGGQINCSTTIHTNADVMRVLSTSAAPPPTATALPPVSLPAPAVPPPKPKMSRLRQAFRPFSSSQSTSISTAPSTAAFPLIEAGAEPALLRNFPALPLAAQMMHFRSTYAHNLVVHYPSDQVSLPIAYASSGLTSTINPAAPASAPNIGTDVFRFVKDNLLAPTQMPAFRDRVLAALREGRAVSVKVGLKTRRSVMGRGEESFVSHWTPVKDERSQIGYVVVCLSGEFD